MRNEELILLLGIYTCLQVVGHQYRILNMNAKFPGSAHDSHIWRMNAVRQHPSTVYQHTGEWMLGDRGYPLNSWLLTPIDNPTTPDEVIFNNHHAITRNIVEQAIGLLKARLEMSVQTEDVALLTHNGPQNYQRKRRSA